MKEVSEELSYDISTLSITFEELTKEDNPLICGILEGIFNQFWSLCEFFVYLAYNTILLAPIFMLISFIFLFLGDCVFLIAREFNCDFVDYSFNLQS